MSQMAAFGGAPFSARVRLWLEYGDTHVSLSHVEPTRIIARNPIDFPPGDGVVVVTVNAQPFARRVTLVFGMRADEPETLIRPHDSIPI